MPLAKHLPRPSWAALGFWAGFRLGNSRQDVQSFVSNCVSAGNETCVTLLPLIEIVFESAHFRLRQLVRRQGLPSIASTQEAVRSMHALAGHSNDHGERRQAISQHRPTPGCSGDSCVRITPATCWVTKSQVLISIGPWLVQAVLAPSQVMPENAATVQGWNFEHGCTLDGLLQSFLQTGFQATAFGRAVVEVTRMVSLHSVAAVSALLAPDPARNRPSSLQLDRLQS